MPGGIISSGAHAQSMQNRYDVVVVGAGPAGSTAARYAAAEGLDVLLLDKKKTIGVPVCCGEFIPSGAVTADAFPDAPGVEELFPVDRSLVERDIGELVVRSPKGREYHLPLEGCTVRRDAFDQHLADLAAGAGATIVTDTKFLGLDGHRVATTRGTVEAGVVIAADGPVSAVCRSAGLERSSILSPAVTCRVDGEFPDGLQIFFGSRIAPGGYAWIFPKMGCANIGLGVQRPGAPVRKLLEAFLAERGYTAGAMQACFIPVSGPIGKTVQGNVLAVGDAAGHVVASNGGGISIAMICGRIAGLAAARHLREGEPLAAYERDWRAAVGKELLAAAKMKLRADRFLVSDFLLDQMMKRLGVAGIERLMVYNGAGRPDLEPSSRIRDQI